MDFQKTMIDSIFKYILLFVILIGLILLACSTKSIDQVQKYSVEQLRSMKEAPSLAKMVQAGDLPPLVERLPEDPLVVEPRSEPGLYGGAWHFDIISRRDVNLVYHISTPCFVMWTQDGIHTKPYFCKDFKMTDAGRVWTFHLRKGVRWSDGHPFTSEDVRFWYEDDAMNRDITPTPKMELQIGREFGRIEIRDDYTFRVIFPTRFEGFPQTMTSIVLFYVPGHYLKQFHEKYADPEELQQKMRKAGMKKWSELYLKMDRWYDGFYNPDRPTMRPWMLSPERGSPNTFEFIRNPYFWAVDTEGRQLPYIDRIIVHIASNDQVLAMKTIAGDFDFQWRRLDFKDYPLLKENEERHDYRLLTWPQDRGSDIALYINYNCNHPIVGPLLRERHFRIALSVSIDREELNLLFYRNVGVPRQVTAAEITPFYNPELAKKYARYDVDQANLLLNELGLNQRDGEGFRLDERGNPILLFLETSDLNRVDILQIVSEYWRAVGIKTEVRIVEGSLLTRRTQSAQIMIQARPHGSFDRRLQSRSDYIAPMFGLWRNSIGKHGEEPTPLFKEMIRLGDEIIRNDPDDQIELFEERYRLFAENVWMIGLVGEVPALLAKKNYFMNVPEKALYSYSRGRRLQLTNPEQYWIDPVKKGVSN